MKKMGLSFLMGGTIYALIEVLYKRKTHISMFLAGGAALCIINYICTKKIPKKSLFLKCSIGSVVISVIELITGLIVNNLLKLDVWDYSHLPLNFKGQICLLFSFFWFFITIPAIYVSKIINARCEKKTSFNKIAYHNKKPAIITEVKSIDEIPLQKEAS